MTSRKRKWLNRRVQIRITPGKRVMAAVYVGKHCITWDDAPTLKEVVTLVHQHWRLNFKLRRERLAREASEEKAKK